MNSLKSSTDDKYFATQNITVQCGSYKMEPEELKIFVEDALNITIDTDGHVVTDDPDNNDYKVMFVLRDVGDFIKEALVDQYIKISVNMGELREPPPIPPDDDSEPWGF